jgi:ABC-type bacteriocin/lantibiotic exporter with double-glycine peptidase domain
MTLIFSVFYVALFFYYNAKLALFMSLISLLYVFLISLFLAKNISYYKHIYRIEGDIAGRVLQFLTGIEKIKITASENKAFSIWSDLFAKQKNLALKSGKIQRLLAAFNSALPIFTLAGLFYWIVVKAQDEMSVGRFIGFLSAFSYFQTVLIQFLGSLFACVAIKPVYDRTMPILEALPEFDETKTPPGELSGEIEVKNLEFRYSGADPLVLKNISLYAKPGEFIALVGPSGSGKSTLLRCLLGFETPLSGNIYYDKQVLASLDIHDVRQQAGVVLQTSRLISGNIFSNIVGVSGLTIDDAWGAARAVGLEEDLKSMPMGMFTVVGAGLGSFSGGQRQKILIARAIIKKPRILYFDEATSSVDNRTQAKILESINRLRATRIVITHRLSTVMKADRIYVFDKGEIVQAGKYDELISQGGIFSELAKRQLF